METNLLHYKTIAWTMHAIIKLILSLPSSNADYIPCLGNQAQHEGYELQNSFAMVQKYISFLNILH